MEYYTERISKDNFDSFLEVFKISFGIEIDESYFVNKFNTGFTSLNVIGYIAFEKSSQEPAAFYGVYPTEVLFSKNKVIAAQSGDTGTHPNHRKKGLFKLLHDLTMEACKEEKIPFIFGFCYPTQASYYGFMKFNWNDQSVLSTLVRSNKIKVKSKLIRKISSSLFYRLRTKAIEKKKVKLDEIYTTTNFNVNLEKHQSKITIPKSENYLGYKMALGSFCLKFKNGVAWVSIINNKVEIGDLFGANIEDLLNELINFCESVGYNYLEIKSNDKELQNLFLNNFEFKMTNKDYHLIINYLDSTYEPFNLICTGGDIDSFGI